MATGDAADLALRARSADPQLSVPVHDEERCCSDERIVPPGHDRRRLRGQVRLAIREVATAEVHPAPEAGPGLDVLQLDPSRSAPHDPWARLGALLVSGLSHRLSGPRPLRMVTGRRRGADAGERWGEQRWHPPHRQPRPSCAAYQWSRTHGPWLVAAGWPGRLAAGAHVGGPPRLPARRVETGRVLPDRLRAMASRHQICGFQCRTFAKKARKRHYGFVMVDHAVDPALSRALSVLEESRRDPATGRVRSLAKPIDSAPARRPNPCSRRSG